MTKSEMEALPRAPASARDGIYSSRCQACGSYGVAARLNGDDTLVFCRDCGRFTAHPDPRLAFSYFLRRLKSADKLDHASLSAAEKVCRGE